MFFRTIISPIIQRLFGAALLFFAINKIFSFVPLPEKHGFALEFLNALTMSAYIMPIIVIVQLVTGLLLLSNRYVGLALVVMFPISINIFLFHVFHDAKGLIPATILMAWNSILVLANIHRYRPLFAVH